MKTINLLIPCALKGGNGNPHGYGNVSIEIIPVISKLLSLVIDNSVGNLGVNGYRRGCRKR
jgi:hypothetical protein